jgi:hypothetical protein
MRALLVALLIAGSLARPARAGEVGYTLGSYASAGAGVGALLGSAAATIPYLQSHQPYDFLTGAGIGLLGGSVVGFILGMVDLANPAAEQAQPQAALAPALFLALTPQKAELTWSRTF